MSLHPCLLGGPLFNILYYSYEQSNTRTDDYSAMPGNSLRLLHQIVSSIRAVTPPNFILGVKISSADYVEAGSGLALDEKYEILSMEEERAVGHVKEIARWKSVDFIEISGGDYECPGQYLPLSLAYDCRHSLTSSFDSIQTSWSQLAKLSSPVSPASPAQQSNPFLLHVLSSSSPAACAPSKHSTTSSTPNTRTFSASAVAPS